MGVMENMLHSESLRKVTSVNGSHSEGRLGKMPMENVDCSFRTGPSKYKKRIVSAVREFPPGCGPLAQQNQSPEVSETLVPAKRLEQENVLTSEEKMVVSSESGNELESVKAESVQIHSPVLEELSNIVLGEPINAEPMQIHSPVAEALSDPVLSEPVKAEPVQIHSPVAEAVSNPVLSESVKAEPVQIHLPVAEALSNPVLSEPVKIHSPVSEALNNSEPVKDLEDAAFDLSKNLNVLGASASKEETVSPSSCKSWSPSDGPNDVPTGSGLKKTMAKNYPPRRKVSAIRDFPPLCGRNAPCLSKEDSLEVLRSLKNKSLCQDKSDMGDKPSEETRKADVKRMGEDVQDADAQKSELWRNVSMITGDKIGAESEGCATKEIRKRDVQDADAQKSELWRNVSMITGDRAASEGCATKEIRKRDEFGMSSEMKVERDDSREKYTRPSKIESNQHQSDHNSEIVVIKKSRDIGILEEKMGKEVVVYEKDPSRKRKLSDISGYQIQLQEDLGSLKPVLETVVVQGLMAAPHCPWKQGQGQGQGKGAFKPYTAGITSQSKGKTHNSLQLGKYKSAVRTKDKAEGSGVKSKKKKSSIIGNTANQGKSQMVIWDKEHSPEEDDECQDFYVAPRPRSIDVNLPPIRQSVSVKSHDSDAITRSKVRETLRLFQAICRKLLQEEEANVKVRGHSKLRVDYKAARILKEHDKYVNVGKQILGSVPGVEVGDEFHYRVELNIIGLHRQIQGGIDYVKNGGLILATSIVASGGYADDLDNSDSLIYTGQGGNVMNTDKEPEDQKLERGNLALKNSMHERNPVRVIRGTESSDGRTYIYDGLYLVVKCWQDYGPHGKLVFKFQLDRIQGQPELAWKELKKSKKFKTREGLCVDDISQGKESIPICAVNTIDDEKPPPFQYITSMIYPDWCRPLCPKGCNCTNGCSDSEKCLCAVMNGGEIPFNHNGAIVEAKALVYECGPSCKCSSSCHNRVSQRGIKFQLEIFKTKSRGWGVRSLNSIPSGSFICEYIGELLEEKEADQRTGNDEYLFDIGNNYNDSSLWDGLSSLMPDVQASSSEVVVGDGSFTIDAAQYGNVGRFINHSCSPNLYAQNVLYDHEDKRIPHIMLFAAENIPPLHELTYHYNYMIDQVRDSNGNIKKKSCYCGSIECTGRMY